MLNQMKQFYTIFNSLLCAYYESQVKDIDSLINVISQKYAISDETKRLF